MILEILAKLRLKPTSGGAFSSIAWGEAMLDTRYWIKQKGIPYYQVSRDQYPASRDILLPNVQTKLDTNVKILAHIDT